MGCSTFEMMSRIRCGSIPSLTKSSRTLTRAVSSVFHHQLSPPFYEELKLTSERAHSGDGLLVGGRVAEMEGWRVCNTLCQTSVQVSNLNHAKATRLVVTSISGCAHVPRIDFNLSVICPGGSTRCVWQDRCGNYISQRGDALYDTSRASILPAETNLTYPPIRHRL